MNELGVQGQNFVIHRPLMGVVGRGVPGPGRARLFLHLPEGSVVPFPILIDWGKVPVFVVYAQGFTVGHAHLEMSVQFDRLCSAVRMGAREAIEEYYSTQKGTLKEQDAPAEDMGSSISFFVRIS